MNGPRRKVERAIVRAGASIPKSEFKYRWWLLVLECGHEVERRIKYLRVDNPARGYAAQWQGVPPSRIPPAPKYAFCEDCASASRRP